MTMPLLDASSLCLIRPDGSRVLQDASFGISQGEKVGLVGPNGAGKTSLMLCLTGILPATAGQITLAGQPLRPGAFHRELGFLFQQSEDQLFSPTVAEDVAFGARNTGLSGPALDQAVAQALALVGLNGLGARQIHHLSGGEKRLASLAGLLVMEPRLLLLDEPSAALDMRHRRGLITLLRGMDQAMLIASHDLELVLELCPRVILLDAGRIVADGDAATILGNPDLMARHGQEVPHSLTHHSPHAHAPDRAHPVTSQG